MTQDYAISVIRVECYVLTGDCLPAIERNRYNQIPFFSLHVIRSQTFQRMSRSQKSMQSPYQSTEVSRVNAAIPQVKKKGQTRISCTASIVMRRNNPKPHINSTKTKPTILDGGKASPVPFRWKSEQLAFFVRSAARDVSVTTGHRLTANITA